MGVICVKNVNFASRPFFSEQGNVDDDHLYYDIFGFIQFTVLLPHAVCSLHSAVCSLQMSYTEFVVVSVPTNGSNVAFNVVIWLSFLSTKVLQSTIYL